MSLLRLETKNVCKICKSFHSSTRGKGNWERWYNYEDGKMCNKCYCKYIYKDPLRDFKEYQRERKSRTICFVHTRILLSFKIRKGYCTSCNNNIFDKSCNRTHLHHELGYFPIFVWFGVKELCPSCHGKLGNSGQFKKKSE